jgi:hypothetical protein
VTFDRLLPCTLPPLVAHNPNGGVRMPDADGRSGKCTFRVVSGSTQTAALSSPFVDQHGRGNAEHTAERAAQMR